ncbi:MAG: hypothetical protein J0J10_23095 [Bosea sp.]|uniref:hypothetical protein n=1 Tax=Bosea sp. (in: a-proteobacteria) TaxID=1871050 RepID=UPI001ACF2F7D|nr:hypothetical protein [Bosea sp. (in: a-proteobacteria)]MBN9471659.1 hypothetical protein [Bosea sp. (in: a-proteobacteria)]
MAILNTSDLAAAAALAGADKIDVFQGGSNVPKSADLGGLANFVLQRRQLVALADDTAIEISLGAAVPGFLVYFGDVAGTPRGICWMRCASSPAIADLIKTGTVNFSTSALGGMTGADGVLNLAARNGSFIVENRTGGLINLSTLFLRGE